MARPPRVWHAWTRENHYSNYFFLFLILSFTFSPQGVLSAGNNKSVQGPKLWGRGTFLSAWGSGVPRGWGTWQRLCLSLCSLTTLVCLLCSLITVSKCLECTPKVWSIWRTRKTTTHLGKGNQEMPTPRWHRCWNYQTKA